MGNFCFKILEFRNSSKLEYFYFWITFFMLTILLIKILKKNIFSIFVIFYVPSGH